jgi:hypothetical protein
MRAYVTEPDECGGREPGSLIISDVNEAAA